MWRRLTFVIIAWLGTTVAASATDFYVSPHGKDSWTGTLAEPNQQHTDGPFATLGRAAGAVRKTKAEAATPAEIKVIVRSGIYSLTESLKLGPEHSGTAAKPVVFTAYPNERPLLLGGKQITGFSPYRGSILKAEVGGQGFKGVYFRQLICQGRRQHLARYPNFDAENPYGGGWAYVDGELAPLYQDIPGEDKRTFHYKPADDRNWDNPTEGEVFVFPRYNWWNNIVRIAALDRGERQIKLAADASYPIRPGDRYFVQNLLSELDAPGEWYLDKSTETLYFWPPAAGAEQSVFAPIARSIIEFAPGAAHITLRGFTLECCSGSAIVLRGATDCLVAGNTIRAVGNYGGSGVVVEGGARDGVVGNDISETGSNGIVLSGGDRIKLTSAEHYADNNYIHHVGVFYRQGTGVSLDGVGNRATHNLIHDGPRMGIMFSGNNLAIEYNHIRHVSLETEDTGAVYTGGRDWISSRGSVIRYNFFHDILGYGREKDRWLSPYFAWGVYLDDNTGGVDVIGNVIARASRAGIHLHNGRDNHVENNVFVDNGAQQIEYSGWTNTSKIWKDHFPTMVKGYESVAGQPAWQNMRNMQLHPKNAPLPDGTIMTGNEFRRNIMYYHDPKSRLFKFQKLPLDHYKSEDNLVYHFGHPIDTGEVAVGHEVSDNLLANSGFEEGDANQLPKGWHWQDLPKSSLQAVASGDVALEGKRSLRIEGGKSQDPNGRTLYSVIASSEIPLPPGKTYRISAKIKAEKPDTKVALAAQTYMAHVYFWAKDVVFSVGTDWQPCTLVFKTLEPGDSSYNPQMKDYCARIDFREPSGQIWVDDVTLKEVETLSGWDSWKALGFDQRSLVADPLFIDPAKDDYRLQPNSPAWKLGFAAIPLEKIGPYRDELRASWPIVEAEGAREKPLDVSPAH
jgi:parallel beta-helix repeat protein